MSNIKLSDLYVRGARVAIKREKQETQTSGGIMLPQNSGEKPMIGEVVCVGSGEKDKDGKVIEITDIKVGDMALFQKWGGTEIKTDEGEVVIMNITDVLAIIKK